MPLLLPAHPAVFQTPPQAQPQVPTQAPASSLPLEEAARQLMTSQDWKGLEARSRKALESDPKNVDAWAFLGAALASQNRRPEALKALDAGERLDPKHLRILALLGLTRALEGDRAGTLAVLPRLSAQSLEANAALIRAPEVSAFLNQGEVKVVDFSTVRIELQPYPPRYPIEAKAKRVQGTVIIEVTVDRTGIPVASRAVDGPPELRDTAEVYALAWRFMPWTDPAIQRYRFKLTMPFRLR